MLCVEVWMNGKHLCTAGAQELTRLFAHLTWYNSPADTMDHSPEIKVYGVTAREPVENYFWLKRSLEIGDEINLKLIEAESFDQPESDEPVLHVHTLQHENEGLGVEVGLNDTHLCTAGLEDSGFLFVQFAHHNLPERRKVSDPNLFLEVHSYLDREPYSYFQWAEQGVAKGDEMTFKLIETAKLDQPRKKELLTPEIIDQPIIQQYVALIEGEKDEATSSK